MTEEIANIIRATRAEGNSIYLHELLWTLDAKHHAIPTMDELNIGIERSGGARIVRGEGVVMIATDPEEERSRITTEDIDLALDYYRGMVSKVMGSKKRKPTRKC